MKQMNGLKTSKKNPNRNLKPHVVLFEIVAEHSEGETVILQAVAPPIKKIEEHYGLSIDSLKLRIKEIKSE